MKTTNITTGLATMLLLLTLLTGAAWAQDGEQTPARQRIEAAKIGLITNRLNLTPEQAQPFWAIYNEYNARKVELNKRMRQLGNQSVRGNLAEADVTANLREMNTTRQKLADLDEEYQNKFLKVISARQVIELYNTEREFNRILLNKLRE
jgi:Spy/CpxP family protein refolding chaperone